MPPLCLYSIRHVFHLPIYQSIYENVFHKDPYHHIHYLTHAYTHLHSAHSALNLMLHGCVFVYIYLTGPQPHPAHNAIRMQVGYRLKLPPFSQSQTPPLHVTRFEHMHNQHVPVCAQIDAHARDG